MSDKAKRLGVGHQWWAHLQVVYCNYCQCHVESERAFESCAPEVAGKGFHTAVVDDLVDDNEVWAKRMGLKT